MRVKVAIHEDKLRLEDIFEGQTADDVVAAVKARVAGELPYLLKLAVNAMSPLSFSQELVRRYNSDKHASVPEPVSCEEFIDTAVAVGIASIEQP